MKAVYYFIPELHVVNEREGRLEASLIEKLGLSYAFEDRLVVPDQTVFHHGPGPAGNGTLLFPRPLQVDNLPRCTYAPDEQQWFDCGKYWIGVETDGAADITSEYFKRSSQTLGYSVADALGDEWVFPVIRSPDPRRYCLPTEYSLGFKGEFAAKRRPRDEYLWELAGLCHDFLRVGEGMTEQDVAKAVVSFLGVNYYVSVPEIALLESLGRATLQSEFVAAAIAAVNDFRLIDDVQKKSEITARTNSEPGQPEGTLATGPAAAQSVL